MIRESKFLSSDFSLKRVLILVAVIEAVIAVALFVYYDRFHDDFFSYPINDDGTITVAGAPLLVGYGEAISPPWTFSAVGSDTLLLNGLPFLPMREKDLTVTMDPATRDRLLTTKAILAEAEEAYQKADDKAAGMEVFGATLESYLGVFVSMVVLDREAEQITVDFVDDLPPFTVTFLREPHWIEPEGLRKKQHFDMIEDFVVWMQGNDADAVFSFGPYHTDLTVGDATRDAYEGLLTRLDTIAATARTEVTIDDVRRGLGDDEFVRWQDLIQDYINWRGMHASAID